MEKTQSGASVRPSFYEKLAEGRDVSIVALGDSIIECYGASDAAHTTHVEGLPSRSGTEGLPWRSQALPLSRTT